MSLSGMVIAVRQVLVKVRFSAPSCSSPLQVKMRAAAFGKQSRMRLGVLK